MKRIAGFLLLATVSVVALAASVPYRFTAGAPAVAAEVNADFDALVNAVTALENKVAALEGAVAPSAADVAGTYRLLGMSSKAGSDQGNLSFTAGGGSLDATVALAADGTFTFSGANRSAAFNAKATQCNGPSTLLTSPSGPSTSGAQGTHSHSYTYTACTPGGFVSTETPTSSNDTGTGTWTFASANTLTLSPAGGTPLTVYLAKGARIGFAVESEDFTPGPTGSGTRFQFDVFVRQ